MMFYFFTLLNNKRIFNCAMFGTQFLITILTTETDHNYTKNNIISVIMSSVNANVFFDAINFFTSISYRFPLHIRHLWFQIHG